MHAPMTAAALFVPSTSRSGSPVIISAGIEISPPPPTTASMNAEKKPMMQMKSSISKPMIQASPLMLYLYSTMKVQEVKPEGRRLIG